ncbi:post-GPI attachment to proteins factor 4 [Lepisosteus oculatus]|nr:PREDICTED: transmembrane protein 246 [Lepisosteus oculatus]
MPRWKLLMRRHLRWSSPFAQSLVLCLLTFVVFLPMACHRLLYSYYFIKPLYLNTMSDRFLEESYQKGQEALRYWQGVHSTPVPDFRKHAGQKRPELLITVISAQRKEGSGYHYLLQVMQQLSSLLAACGRQGCAAEVLVCDVERDPLANEDASLVGKWFRVIRRSPQDSDGSGNWVNTFEKEKRDYVFCLRRGWEMTQPENVIVLEDDAVPKEDFFPVVQNLLSRQFSSHTLYVKLYHPERLQRYWNPEPYRILEWIGLGLIGASVLSLLFSLSPSFSFSPAQMVFLTLYVMVFVELVGRHYLLEVRRISPQLYAVSPATECCTPAMLFPGNASLRAAAYLDGTFCERGRAKDIVLYHLARSVPGERAHSLEPNLVTHIGAYSSVRSNPVRPRLL